MTEEIPSKKESKRTWKSRQSKNNRQWNEVREKLWKRRIEREALNETVCNKCKKCFVECLIKCLDCKSEFCHSCDLFHERFPFHQRILFKKNDLFFSKQLQPQMFVDSDKGDVFIKGIFLSRL